jgi:hypothetical protein
MVLIWEGLNDTLHQVLLCHGILAFGDNVKNLGEDSLLVDLKSDSIKHAQSDNILSNCDSKLISFHFSLVSILGARQVLQSYP